MSELKRTLNLFDTVMLVSGSMIGSGIFIVSADMTRTLGSPLWVLACWLLSGVITLFAALSYGELAGMMPEAGGQFAYLRRAFGERTSFVYGWTVFLVIQTGVIAAVAVAFARYTGVFIPFFDEKNVLISCKGFSVSATQLLAVASVFFLSWLNSHGIRNGKMIQRTFTSAKILALAGLIIIGMAFSKESFWTTNMRLPAIGNGISSVLPLLGVAMIGSLFSMDAWNNVTFITAEIKEPKRNIPLGLLIGVLIVTVLYILANVAYFILLPAQGSASGQDVFERGIAFAESDRVGTAAMYPVLGNVAVYIMALLIIISTFGCNNGLILQGARLYKAMGDEGLFFRQSVYLNKHDVPSKSLWLQATWASVLCLSGSYGSLLDYCTFSSILFYMVTIIGLFVLRRREPDAVRPYKTVGYPFVPAFYILIAGLICIDLLIVKPQNVLWGILIILTGVPVYYFFKIRKKPEETSR
jgi:APA family basic amino acid/polyamine antiporter